MAKRNDWPVRVFFLVIELHVKCRRDDEALAPQWLAKLMSLYDREGKHEDQPRDSPESRPVDEIDQMSGAADVETGEDKPPSPAFEGMPSPWPGACARWGRP